MLYDSERVIVFRNALRWVPVMLLAVPRRHMTQRELWESGLLAEVGRVASEIGAAHCPHGYRLVSNLGWEAESSPRSTPTSTSSAAPSSATTSTPAAGGSPRAAPLTRARPSPLDVPGGSPPGADGRAGAGRGRMFRGAAAGRSGSGASSAPIGADAASAGGRRYAALPPSASSARTRAVCSPSRGARPGTSSRSPSSTQGEAKWRCVSPSGTRS